MVQEPLIMNDFMPAHFSGILISSRSFSSCAWELWGTGYRRAKSQISNFIDSSVAFKTLTITRNPPFQNLDLPLQT